MHHKEKQFLQTPFWAVTLQKKKKKDQTCSRSWLLPHNSWECHSLQAEASSCYPTLSKNDCCCSCITKHRSKYYRPTFNQGDRLSKSMCEFHLRAPVSQRTGRRGKPGNQPQWSASGDDPPQSDLASDCPPARAKQVSKLTLLKTFCAYTVTLNHIIIYHYF